MISRVKTARVDMAVLSSSAVLATMVTYFFMIVSPLLAQHDKIKPLFRRPWARQLTEYLYYLFPKYWDLGNEARLAMEGQPFGGWMAVWTSAAFAAVLLAAGLWAFARKDY